MIFLINEENIKTYDDLISDINETKYIENVIKSNDIYVVYKEIILHLLNGSSCLLVDSDLSEDESDYFIKSRVVNRYRNNVKLDGVEDLVEVLLDRDKEFEMTLLTSGTTGRPKEVPHSKKTLLRAIKLSDKYQRSVWGQCYNSTHFAGLQVFFQALCNRAVILNLFRLNKFSPIELVWKYSVSNISMTPTFFKNYFSNCEPMDFVKTITFGGEKSSQGIIDKAKKIFPGAKFNNVFASTEAGTLFSSNDEYFDIKEEDKDKYKIIGNNLYIHKSLLPFKVEDEWFSTGDQVELIDGRKFRFLARNTDFVNVGGYNVNPHEVEDVLNLIDYIDDSVVIARKNSIMGTVLVAEIVTKRDLKDIKKEVKSILRSKLQEWKIPADIKKVDKISYSRTGKKVRGLK